MNSKINGVDIKVTRQIINLILAYKAPEKIVIFGSRAENSFKNNSDIDIAIFGKNWKDKDVNIVKNSLEEFIKIPLKFDIVNFYNLKKPALKENILKEGRVLYGS
jgi:proline iminopeptidase